MPCIMPKMPLPLHADAGMLWHPVRCVSPPAGSRQPDRPLYAGLSGMLLDREASPLRTSCLLSGCFWLLLAVALPAVQGRG
jgi:hypothetical protein